MSADELRHAVDELREFWPEAPIRADLAEVIANWLEAVAITWVWDGHPDDIETPDGWPLALAESTDTYPLALARLINGGAA